LVEPELQEAAVVLVRPAGRDREPRRRLVFEDRREELRREEDELEALGSNRR
jgi:hypothetical protein